MPELEWSDSAIEELLHSMDGPVGRFVAEKGAEMQALAFAGAPIQKQKNWSWGKDSSSYMPRSFGYLKGSVHGVMGYTRKGQLFSGVNSALAPTIFLQDGGGRHGHAERNPFMTNALYAAAMDV